MISVTRNGREGEPDVRRGGRKVALGEERGLCRRAEERKLSGSERKEGRRGFEGEEEDKYYKEEGTEELEIEI